MESTLRRLPVTRRGQAELSADLAWLGSLRREILAERERGVGLAARQPAEWQRIGHELAAVDEQICRVQCDLATALLLEDAPPRVAVGCEVTVVDDWGQTTYVIGGLTTADPRLGRLSYDSPLARALLGHGVGDDVEVPDSAGSRWLRIVSVRTLPVPGLPARREPLAVATT